MNKKNILICHQPWHFYRSIKLVYNTKKIYPKINHKFKWQYICTSLYRWMTGNTDTDGNHIKATPLLLRSVCGTFIYYVLFPSLAIISSPIPPLSGHSPTPRTKLIGALMNATPNVASPCRRKLHVLGGRLNIARSWSDDWSEVNDTIDSVGISGGDIWNMYQMTIMGYLATIINFRVALRRGNFQFVLDRCT